MKPLLFLCYPRCSTCAKARRWLDERGIAYQFRDISIDKPNAAELKQWHEMSGLPIRRLFNTSGRAYRALGLKAQLDAGMDDEDACRILSTDGMLVKRPLLVGEDFVLVGFKEPEWEARLSSLDQGADPERASS